MILRPRLLLLWGMFLAAAGVAGFAVHRLYERARAEIAAQSERAMQQARSAAEERIRQYTDEARRSIITDLAGFHEDGLAGSLQRWDAANEIVTATFFWDAGHGLVMDSDGRHAVPAYDLATLWREFRAWRAMHPALPNRDPAVVDGRTVLAVRTLDNPGLPAASLRYQGENLDLLADAGQKADPWAGWAADRNPGALWVFWYQAGPEAGVGGCIVQPRRLVEVLQREIASGDLARVKLVEAPATGQEVALLPGYRLVAEPGDIFRQKTADARFDALIVALLLGLFLLGAAALGLHTWRDAREAGRKINFITQVSHELRTPLTSIRMFADMLGTPGLPEEKRLKFAGTIGAESARLGGLIERLLAFNALEKGSNRVASAPFDAAALAREAAEETTPRLAEAGLKPVLLLPEVPVPALGDRSIVKQALLNLLDNACKYAADGGVVEIVASAAPGHVSIRVADRGQGIPVAIRDRLFEPFVQGGQTLTTKSPGVGLGLSLARGLLRQTGADLLLAASASGATFEIRLPAAPSP